METRDALQVGNKTRKQSLDEVAAVQSSLTELARSGDTLNRIEDLPGAGETHFAHLFREARIVNLIFDPDGILLSANPLAMTALTVEHYQDAVRKSLFESAYWTPEIRARLAAGEVLRVHITLDTGNDPIAVAHSAGIFPESVSHLESTVSSLGPQGYLVQVHDVTGEVHSKAALREREAFFRSGFQASPYPTSVWKHVGNQKFILHFYNSAAEEATQGLLGQYEGADLDAFYGHAPEFAERVRRTFVTGETLSTEQPYTMRTTGQYRFLRVTTSKVGHEYVIESSTDLTELKQVQQALSDNEARFRRLLENAPDIIYRIALKPELRYEYLSPAATTITGFTTEELMSDLEFAGTRIYPDDRREPPSSIDVLPAIGAPQLLRWIRKDGEVIWLEHRYVVVYDAAEPIAIEGVSRDVTAEVEARQLLERSLSEKELLLQEVHHRVKNNLSILSSLIELQAAALHDSNVRNILRATQGRILSVARVHEALYTTVENVTRIDLADYVSRVGAELREAYSGQGVAMEYDLVHYEISHQRAIHLGLLANELISNAFKHAFPNKDGQLAKVQVKLSEDDGQLQLSVNDDGVGLPEDFDPQTTTSLGVQVVEMLVEQMEGTVVYGTRPGGGTQVCVRIPKSQLASTR